MTAILRQSTRPVAGDCLKIGGVASSAIASLLDGPPRPAELIGSFPVAIYLRTTGGVVGMVGPGGVGLPNAVALTSADHARVRRHAGERPLRVGDGGVHVGPVRVTALRWWDPVPRLGRPEPGVLAIRLGELRSALPRWPDRDDPAACQLVEGRDELAVALGGDGSIEAAANLLVGLGAGLTPAGDDVLAGTMAALAVFGTALEQTDAAAAVRALAAAAAARAETTTALAADLAQHAAHGALAQPAAAVCQAIAGHADGSGDPLRPELDRLLALGHTSGRDLAEGLLLGAWTALSSQPSR